jgi:calcium/calmodulin-dependent protein kinase I
MYQLLSAVHFLHTCQSEPIVHRDLKMENVLVFGEVQTSAGPVPRCKLADFGTARAIPIEQRISDVPMLTRGVGSQQYMAPEFYGSSPSASSSSAAAGAKGAGPAAGGAAAAASSSSSLARYSENVDVYSLGVTMFAVLTSGRLPYTEDTEDGTKQSVWVPRMMSRKVRWAPVDAVLSEAGRDLIRWMIHFNPETRFSAAQCLAHEWFDPIRAEANIVFDGDGVLLQMRRFQVPTK